MKVYRKQKQKKLNFEFNRKKAYLGIIFAVIMLPVSMMIVSSIQASHTGTQLREIEDEIIAIEDANRKLETAIVAESSLFEVTQKVHEFELKKADQVIYIQKENNSVAQAR